MNIIDDLQILTGKNDEDQPQILEQLIWKIERMMVEHETTKAIP